MSLNQLLTFLILYRASDADTARRLALAWRGDRFAAYEHVSTTATAATFRSHFVDASAAREVATLLTHTLGTGTTRTDDAYVTVAISSDGSPVAWAFDPP